MIRKPTSVVIGVIPSNIMPMNARKLEFSLPLIKMIISRTARNDIIAKKRRFMRLTLRILLGKA
jgi:predicted site-specific integrase-resolvase